MSAFFQYVTPNDDGTYTVYDNDGKVVIITKDRAYAARLAAKFSAAR